MGCTACFGVVAGTGFFLYPLPIGQKGIITVCQPKMYVAGRRRRDRPHNLISISNQVGPAISTTKTTDPHPDAGQFVFGKHNHYQRPNDFGEFVYDGIINIEVI